MVITTAHLAATDADASDSTLIYTVSDVNNGTLTINGKVWVAFANDTFTQQDIINGTILYTHDGSNTLSDSFTFSVSDPAGNLLTGQTMAITVTPVDDIIILPDPDPEDESEDNEDDQDTKQEDVSDETTQDIDERADDNTTTTVSSEPTEDTTSAIGSAVIQEEYNLESFNPIQLPLDETEPEAITDTPEFSDNHNRRILSSEYQAREFLAVPLDNSNIPTLEFTNNHQDDGLWKAIETLQARMNQSSEAYSSLDIKTEVISASMLGLTAGVTGLVLRSGAIIASIMSSASLFVSFDPLPVVTNQKGNTEPQKTQSTQDTDVSADPTNAKKAS